MPLARAILAGLNQVGDHYGKWDGRLIGPRHDVADMATIAEQVGFEVNRPLLDHEATSDSLLSELSEASHDLYEGDTLLVFYSGHGGQIPNLNDDGEPDHLDETLCLHDRMLIDDELREAWSRFREGVRIVSIADCCHSRTLFKAPLSPLSDSQPSLGSDRLAYAAVRALTRIGDFVRRITTHMRSVSGLAEGVKAIPRDAALETYRIHRSVYDTIQERLAGHMLPVEASLLHLAACKDDQLALDGQTNSRFTFVFKRVWNHGAFHGTYRSLHAALVKHSPRSQVPQLETLGVNATQMLDTPALKVR